MKKPRKRRPSRSKYPGALLKGSFRLPTGGYVTSTSSVFASQRGPRRITVIGVRRENPDLKLLAQTLVELAKQQIEREEQERQNR
jgi:hypothetical protein